MNPSLATSAPEAAAEVLAAGAPLCAPPRPAPLSALTRRGAFRLPRMLCSALLCAASSSSSPGNSSSSFESRRRCSHLSTARPGRRGASALPQGPSAPGHVAAAWTVLDHRALPLSPERGRAPG